MNNKRKRVLLRYEYYEMKNSVKDLSKMTPPNMEWLNGVLGWCAKSVDSISDRLIFREFKDDNFNINEIYKCHVQAAPRGLSCAACGVAQTA